MIAYKLTGTNFRGQIAVDFVAEMKPGHAATLYRERNNELDKMAIKVLADQGPNSTSMDIGYIGRPHNAKLSRLMDADPDVTWHGKFGYMGTGKSKIPAIQVEVPDDD